MTMASPRYGRQPADSGSFYVGGVEVRTVPSRTFPDLATALSNLGNGSSVSPPNVVVRLLTGNFECDRLYINNPVVIEGDGKGLPTIRCVGADGLRITGRAATGCALRRLRICADGGMPAVTVQDASPVIDGCELLGAGGETHRGSPPGLLVKGQKSRPIIRGCLISGHAGPGVIFKAYAGGVLAHCEVSKCGCGVWLEEGGNPLLWRNTISGQRGAGLVVKADGSGSAVGNSILQNGAAGMLIESSRCLVTAMVKNRVWENRVQDLRQSPAPSGHTAAESGTILLNNHIGKRDDNGGNGGNDPSSTMISVWPRRSARDAAELKSAIADAPRDRTVLIEIVGSIELEERLVIDRPIVLVGSGPGSAEIRGGSGAEAAICVVRGGEASAFRWLTLRLQGGGSITRAAGSCVDVRAGRPTFLECDFNAALQQVDGRLTAAASSERPRLTHAVRVAGEGVSPVFAGCILRGASSVGLVIDGQASACLVQCELSRNRQGGSFLGRAASLVAESCKICGNGHFGVVVGPRAAFVYIGNSTVIGNVAGSMWHCGHSADMEGESESRSVSSRDPPPLIWMDHCTLAGPGLHSGNSIGSAGPAVVIGPGAGAVLWESFLLHQSSSRRKNGHEVNGSNVAQLNGSNGSSGGKLMLVRVEATARVAIASNGPIGGWPGWAGASTEKSGVITGIPSLISGVGTAVLLDISGAGPPTPPPLPEPQVQAPVRPSYSEHLWRAWEAPPPLPPPPGMPVSPMPGYAAPPPPPAQRCARAKTAPAQHPSSRPSAGARSTPASPVMPEASAARDRRGSTKDSKPTPSQPAQQPPPPPADVPPPAPEEKKAASSPDIDARVARLMSLQGSIKIFPGESSMDDDHRTTLYEVLAMLVVKYKCKDSLMSAGLGGPLRPDDVVFFRGHTGRWVVVKDGKAQCNASDRESATSFRLKSVGAVENGVFNTGNMVSLVALGPDGLPAQQLGVVPPAGEIKPVSESSADTQFIFDVESGKKAYSGMPVFLKGKGCQKNVDVKGDTVNGRFADRGTLQRIVLERMMPEPKLPPPCPEKSFTDLEVAWLFLRGAQHGLIDRQFLAAALSSHKGPAKDLLVIYTKLWWEECKSSLPPELFGKGGSSGKRGRTTSDASGSSRRSKSPSAWLRDKLSGGGGSSVDNSNAELFMAGLRSYFLRAVRMSQLEADCVQRVIEAFANELAGDSDFMGNFNQSMKPKPERKVYKEDEECLFGLTYMVVILNTDAHNSQVAERVMDYKKFVAAGQKDCGVTGGLMSAIYKLVEAEEL